MRNHGLTPDVISSAHGAMNPKTNVTGHHPKAKHAAPSAPEMFAANLKSNPGVGAGTGSGQEIPDATIVHGVKGGIAQSKYGAPPGWWTAAGTKSEGYIWRSPKGTEVQGHAPAVFAFKG